MIQNVHVTTGIVVPSRQIETVLRDRVPTDAMLSDGEINHLTAALHHLITGCNLQREDFLPGDPACVDGGEPIHHDHDQPTERTHEHE